MNELSPEQAVALGGVAIGSEPDSFLVGLIGRWRWPVITAVVLLWICSLGLVSQTLLRWLESPWQRKAVDTAPAADAIVVLSGARHPAPGLARLSEWHDPDRFLAGVALYRAAKAPRLLFTGGASPYRPGQPLKVSCISKKQSNWGFRRLPWPVQHLW